MKPFQLIAALMHRDALGSLPLAKKMGKPKLQSQIHRFINGEVANPARTTAAPLATFFKIPVDAIYEEKVATEVAKRLGLKPAPLSVKRRVKAAKTAKVLEEFDADTLDFAREYAKMDVAGRQQMWLELVKNRPGLDKTKIASLCKLGEIPPGKGRQRSSWKDPH